MQYLLLIHHEAHEVSPGELPHMMTEYGALTQDLAKAGKLRGGERLESSKLGATVRVRNGKPIVIDGPFAETKEQLGGFFIVEAEDPAEAIAIAARIPGARNGSVEVRSIASRPAQPS